MASREKVVPIDLRLGLRVFLLQAPVDEIRDVAGTNATTGEREDVVNEDRIATFRQLIRPRHAAVKLLLVP